MIRTLAPIAYKLRKLLRLLTSGFSGEVVAAARSIDRTLKSAGLDIHSLAECVRADKKFTEADAVEIYQRGLVDGRRAAEQQQPAFRKLNHYPSWNAIACECAAKAERLRDQKEKGFVTDMGRWTVRGSERTENQAKWLRPIYTRIRQ
jgi:hypothetical protein